MVCVDYADILALTLPYNRKHFDRVMVVTSLTDTATTEVAVQNGATLFKTGAFYDDGAAFNKWLALEQGLSFFPREGWLAILDADVLWPQNIEFAESTDGMLMISTIQGGGAYLSMALNPGYLYSPLRRMWNDWPSYNGVACGPILPKEDVWPHFPLHRQQHEFAGYSQIFHADDPALGTPPWHQTDWIHAGGADSFFQEKWPANRKIRPSFEVLHLGPAGHNWFGRSTPYADGTIPEGAADKERRNMAIWQERRRSGFSKEKIQHVS